VGSLKNFFFFSRKIEKKMKLIDKKVFWKLLFFLSILKIIVVYGQNPGYLEAKRNLNKILVNPI
jgi:hypothetical protein